VSELEPEDVRDEPAVTAAPEPLFPLDTGTLSFDARRVLVQLLRGPALDESRQPLLWLTLLQEEARLRSRLCEHFLELVLDREARVAFVRQVDVPDLDAPRLLQRLTLTYLQSVILLELRILLVSADGRGERATISHDDLKAKLHDYDKGTGTDHAGFTKRINSAIATIHNKGFLKKIPGASGRYEVSPVLKLLFPLDQVRALQESYRQLALTGALSDDEPAAEGE
jgi:hypothetical protein